MTTLPSTLLPLVLLAVPVATDGGFLGVWLDEPAPRVTEVIPGSPAARAGIRTGDLFIKVGDKATPDTDTFLAVVKAYEPGDAVRFELRRGDRTIQKTIRLEKRPDDLEEAVESRPEAEPPAPPRRPGLRARGAAPRPPAVRGAQAARPYLGVRLEADGVTVGAVVEGGPAAKAGLRAGDRIVAVGDNDQIDDFDDLARALGRLRAGETVPVRVRRGEDTEVLSVELGTRPVRVEIIEEEEEVVEEEPEVGRKAVRAHDLVPPAKARESARERSELTQLRDELRRLRREIAELKELIRRLHRDR